MALFLSTFTNKIDKKGRVSVPASFRAAIAEDKFQGVVLFRSYKFNALEGSDMERMHQMSQSVDQMDQFSQEQDDLAATIFADAHQLSFDNDGRILLPQDLIEYMGLTQYAAFVGRGSTFQIWDPDQFKQHQEQARGRAMEKNATLRLSNIKAD